MAMEVYAFCISILLSIYLVFPIFHSSFAGLNLILLEHVLVDIQILKPSWNNLQVSAAAQRISCL